MEVPFSSHHAAGERQEKVSEGRAGRAAALGLHRAQPHVPPVSGIPLDAGLGRQQFPQECPGWPCTAAALAVLPEVLDMSCQGWAGRARALGTASLVPTCRHLLLPTCPRPLGRAGLEQSPACHIPELSGCFYFLTCSDSSSFMSSFGGNRSLAWMYSKLGGPSSPCIANRAHSQTTSASKCCESQKLKLLDTLGTPGAWGYLRMEMPVLPPDPAAPLAVAGCPQH